MRTIAELQETVDDLLWLGGIPGNETVTIMLDGEFVEPATGKPVVELVKQAAAILIRETRMLGQNAIMHGSWARLPALRCKLHTPRPATS